MAPLETASTFLVSMTTQYTTILPRHDNPVSVYGRTEYIALSLSLSFYISLSLSLSLSFLSLDHISCPLERYPR
jgi:hypothetical protein